MLARGIIERSSSPWSFPIVLVKKKDGSTRFCVDFRKLNMVTKKDAHLIPRLDETFDHLSGTAWFSTLDLASGYWQVKLKDSDKEKTAFSTPFGLYVSVPGDAFRPVQCSSNISEADGSSSSWSSLVNLPCLFR